MTALRVVATICLLVVILVLGMAVVAIKDKNERPTFMTLLFAIWAQVLAIALIWQ